MTIDNVVKPGFWGRVVNVFKPSGEVVCLQSDVERKYKSFTCKIDELTDKVEDGYRTIRELNDSITSQEMKTGNIKSELEKAVELAEEYRKVNLDINEKLSTITTESIELNRTIVTLREKNSKLDDNLVNLTDKLKKQPARKAGKKSLSCKDAKEIRASHSTGAKVKDLAKEFGVSKTTLSRIIKGITYKKCL